MKRVVAYYKFCYMPSQPFHTESLAYASYTKLQQHQIYNVFLDLVVLSMTNINNNEAHDGALPSGKGQPRLDRTFDR